MEFFSVSTNFTMTCLNEKIISKLRVVFDHQRATFTQPCISARSRYETHETTVCNDLTMLKPIQLTEFLFLNLSKNS